MSVTCAWPDVGRLCYIGRDVRQLRPLLPAGRAGSLQEQRHDRFSLRLLPLPTTVTHRCLTRLIALALPSLSSTPSIYTLSQY